MNFSASARRWLGRNLEISPRELQISRLKGGVSSSVFRVESAKKLAVLRVFDNARWLREEPDLPRHERAALLLAHQKSLAAPRFLALEESGAVFGAPALLMSHCAGEIALFPANFAGYLEEMARVLAQIHAHEAPRWSWNWCSWTPADKIAVPAWTSRPALWRAALAVWRRGAPESPRELLHRDFHPLNLLWKGDKISAVVDWPNACGGPAGADVAHCRVNLALLFGARAAAQFLAAYEKRAPHFEFAAWFELDSLFDWANPSPNFYAPWADFGAPRLEILELQTRLEAHLERILARV